jgi:endonuclease/exonuclease/phosphatase family metal-dependent hydrolase
MQVKKDLMVNGLFNDWWDWSKGNALFSNIAFSRLSDTNKAGVPRNVPLYQPTSYEGSRDTDPRYVILARLKHDPFPFVLNLHLSTLTGERGENAWSEVVDAARVTRSQQISGLISLIERHVLLPQLPMILMGDFTATAEEYTLRDMLERDHGIIHLKPQENFATHPRAGAVDHIFFFPAKRLVEYKCFVVNSPLSHTISDHLPVVADITYQ